MQKQQVMEDPVCINTHGLCIHVPADAFITGQLITLTLTSLSRNDYQGVCALSNCMV